MPRSSSIADHPRRAEAERLILAGDRSVASIARELALPVESAKRYARRLRAQNQAPESPPAAMTALATFELAFGFPAMPHQVAYLESTGHLLVRKGRQVGMTSAAAALAIHVARQRAGNLAAVISPSLRQSTELAMRARIGLWALGEQMVQDSVSLLRLANGSRILSLPGSARGVRGYAAALVIVDEAGFVDDATFTAVRALVAATGGRVIVQSTPGNPVGFFHALSTDTPPDWSTIVVRSDEASTIDPAFLARERAEMAPELYRQEYEAEFGSGADALGGLFTEEMVQSMFVEQEDIAL